MSDLPGAVVRLWAQAMNGALEVGRTYYMAMTETLTAEADLDSCSGEGHADAHPRSAPTGLRLSEVRDGNGAVHAVTNCTLVPSSVPASNTYTPVDVSLTLDPSCSSGMLLATLLDDAGAPASDEFSIYVSMPE